MNILALDTATEACSAALMTGGQTLSRFEIAGRSHTERMVPMVRQLMAEAGITFSQLDGYVCGIGPGSFAGVRIGLGFMKGLALAADRPAVGVSSLETLALPALRNGAAKVLVAIDARMNEVYLQGFVADEASLPSSILQAQVSAPDAIPALEDAQHWTGVGTGWAAYESALRSASGLQQKIVGDALPHAADALVIGHARLLRGEGVSLDGIVPRYLRNKVALTLEEQSQLRAR